MGETTSSAPHSRAHDKSRNPFHRKNRAPRRTRFSGRTTPGGESLDTHTAAQAAKESKDTPAAAPAPESAAPATAATPTALADSPRDTDLRVDALEIGPRNRRLTRFLGERLYDKLGPSATYVRRSASFLITSPGRLTIVALILIVAILAAGLSMWQTTSQRQQQLTRISQLSEPMANASQNLYASLTIADASANTAFSRGTLNSSQDLVSNFDDVIAQASMSATRAATGIENVDDPEMKDVATVQRLLPVYTGMVETARANARQGNPVSVAYLASASNLMQVQILPAAKSLYERTSTTTNEEQRELSKPPLFPMSGLAAAILMLLITQWWLTRRTGRLFNVGLFGATMLMAIALVGVGIATTQPWQSNSLFGEQRPDVHALTQVRIDAQQLRASETLGLVRRQPADAESFSQSVRTLVGELERVDANAPDDDVRAAIHGIYSWESGHNLMMEHLSSGDYAGAVRIATDVDNASSSATAFNQVDESLQNSIAESRLTARENLDQSRRAIAALSLATVTLTVIAAVLVVFGFRHRLLEYL
ncbi:hypothetical protein ACOJA0_00710 [Corynebacterium amycolatum]|uniref:hypothetical protein n=1 Tax=Corynebacterium amycolatum TaxID=43765 RepID=UPI00211A5F96|nr:hypothetical protein [Corynebacterium amycolatum]MCQ9126268.1 hypothetical protein [Corynebacterium amycolatum]MCQ9170319.1 hypothetical protein [Corynebacterium amycolatum]MCQ9176634.1 hypothetical protein [Corynebacterium amycolatum]